MNIFVGNLLFEATEADVRKIFRNYGEVAGVSIVMEKNGAKSRGFGFVEMPKEEQALAAIEGLNEKDFMGRPLLVSQAVSPGKKKESKQSAYKAGRRSRSYMRKKAKVLNRQTGEKHGK